MSKFKPQYRRLLFIDRAIRAGRHPNCSSLGEEWEVSPRTIQRDVDYLKYELDAPIEYDAQRHGFYYSDRTWFLPSVMLSEGDLLAVLLGRQALDMYRGLPVAADLGRVYAKLAELLPDKIAVAPEYIGARFSFHNAPARIIEPEVWRRLLQGLLHQRVLETTYQSPSAGRPRPHVIHPYHVANLEGEWYLLARDERWPDVCQYAVARFRRVTVTDRPFEVPADFDGARLLANRFGRYVHHRAGRAVPVRLRFDADLATYVREKQWHPRQQVKARRGGGLDLSFPVADPRDVLAWVLGFGAHVRVIAPSTLRDAVRTAHATAAQQYPGR